MDENKKLTMKQRLFVEAYFECNYNGAEAARRAGYEGNNQRQISTELLSKPHIKAAIEVRAVERVKELKVTTDYVLRKLINTVEKAETQSNHSAVLRGLELIGRHLVMFTDKQEITGKDGEAIKYEQISKDVEDFTRSISNLSTPKELPNIETKPDIKLVKGN